MTAFLPDLIPTLNDPDAPYEADHALEAFLDWTLERGIELYPAQEVAVMHLAAGSNVVLATPTGTGKSLVALAAHAFAIAAGGRTYYTAPIKALVSEKFSAWLKRSVPSGWGWLPATRR